MKRILILSICTLFLFVLSVCDGGNDYRDPYVGNYVGSGYSGTVVIAETGVSEDVESESNVITVGKDKSSVHMLTIKIDDQTYKAHLDGNGFYIDRVETDFTGNTPGYTYQVYQTGNGTITPTTINLQIQYSGTAKYDPDPNDPSKIRYYDISGSGMCSGTK